MRQTHVSPAVLKEGVNLMAESKSDSTEPVDGEGARPRGGGPDSSKSFGGGRDQDLDEKTPRGGGPDSSKSFGDATADQEEGEAEAEKTARTPA